MARYYTTFDDPDDYPQLSESFVQGESPRLLQSLLSFIEERKDQVEEIYFTLPYFNNTILDNNLRKLSQQGVKVQVVCLPIQVFDKKKIQWYVDLTTGKEAFEMAKTPYQLARPVFAAHFKNPTENYQLHCFDHYSIRDVNAHLAASELKPYALQMTTCMMIYKKGGGAFATSSSNFAVGVLPGKNHLCIIEDDWGLLKSGRRFFEQLIEHSVITHHYDFQSDNSDKNIEFQEIDQPVNASFTAPFLKDAAINTEEKLMEQIQASTEEIIIVSPDVSAYEYNYNGAYHSGVEDEVIENYGVMRTVLERAGAGVEVKVISATEKNVDNNFFELFKTYPHTSLAIHSDVKSSFLILDHKLVLMAEPLNSEQFIYLDQVKIIRDNQEVYSGVYSGINHFIIIENEVLVDRFRKHSSAIFEAAKKLK